jgi:transposase
MEAYCGAHHLGRVFAAHGHDVRLMSPEYVRPYVKAQKNDDRDAEGIAEAATRPTMRFVDLKSQEQLDMQTLHRSRDRLVGERTALINQLRAILRAKQNEEVRRLTTIPGFGAIVTSALVAAIGQAESFDRGRDLAAWLGLVPQQYTTGGKPKLLGISKRGNKYLRRQLIHGARAALPYVAERDTALGRWAKGLMSRAETTPVEICFEDEARIGQKNG